MEPDSFWLHFFLSEKGKKCLEKEGITEHFSRKDKRNGCNGIGNGFGYV
jgi:hypothetical protein